MSDRWYPIGLKAALTGTVDWDSDTLKMALLTSSYTFSEAHDFFDDLTNEVTGTGYTAGGATLASVALTSFAATAWAVGTAYAAGKIVRPSTGNGYLYRSSGGTSHASTEPTWPTTIGATVTDNGITWTCVGRSIVMIDAADPSWTTATITARYGVIYKSTGTAGTSALLVMKDFGGNITSTAGTFTVTFDAQGIAQFVLE
jgi:hypothetical protein